MISFRNLSDERSKINTTPSEQICDYSQRTVLLLRLHHTSDQTLWKKVFKALTVFLTGLMLETGL